MIAEYWVQTLGKTYNVVKSALGGVLLIDEAYAITAGTGDRAQYGNECIATRYFTGKGVQKDFELALRYFEKAKTAGNIKGTYGIAKCYFYIRGLKQDYEKSFKIFKNLYEEKNDNYSLTALVDMYYRGRWTKQDFKKARELGELFEKYKNDKSTAYFLGEISLINFQGDIIINQIHYHKWIIYKFFILCQHIDKSYKIC